MIVTAGVVFLLVLLPAITWFRPELRYPSLVMLIGILGFKLIKYTSSGTGDLVKPFLAQVICPLLAGYIISELMHGRQFRYKKGART